jgi:isopenicillin-N epimerase
MTANLPASSPWRGDFALADDLAFLNHGSFGACPKPVLAAQAMLREQLEANPPRFMRETMPAGLDVARAALARFLGAQAEDIGFADNATGAVAMVLRSLELSPDDEIVASSLGYNAVRNAIRYVCRCAGARYVEAHVPMPAPSADDIVAALESRLNARTRLLVVDHIASESALVLPIERLVASAHAKGIAILIDGAHGPGQVPLALNALGADYYAGSGHKWLSAPKGTAFLWARRDRQRGLHPLTISHFLDQGFGTEFAWQGTRDPTPWLSLPAALAYRANVGEAVLDAHCRVLIGEAVDRLVAAWGVAPATPPALRAYMATLPLPGRLEPSPEMAITIGRRLHDEHRIESQIMAFDGRLWCRITAFLYNVPEDYRRLAAAVPVVLAGL